jgi:hypothetical protein
VGAHVLEHISYYYLQPSWNPKPIAQSITKASVKAFFYLLRRFMTLSKRTGDFPNYGKNDFIFIVDTHNHLNVFSTLEYSTNMKVWRLSFSKIPAKYNPEKLHPFTANWRDKFLFLPAYYKLLKEATPLNRKKHLVLINTLYINYLAYKNCYAQWSDKPCKGVVLFNDHTPIFRTLELAANHSQIPTYYIPHASVSKYFPALNFSKAFLYSEQMKETYHACGASKTEVTVTGNLNYMNLSSHKKPRPMMIKCVGFAIGLHMTEHQILETIHYVLNSGVDLIVRPHPRYPEKKWNRILIQVENLQMVISQSSDETVIDFLQSVDVLLSPVSNLFLEAAIINVPAVQLWMDGFNRNDNYGFIDNQLVVNLAHDVKDLECFMRDASNLKYPTTGIVEHYAGPLDKKAFDLVKKYFAQPQ